MLFFLLVVLVSFFDYLNEETGFAIFANKLFIIAGVQLTGAHRAERDFGAHPVLNTRMVFQSQRAFYQRLKEFAP